MNNEWKTVLFAPARTDIVSVQAYALGMCGAFFMATERFFWLGALIAAIGLVANIAIPRVAMLEMNRAPKNPEGGTVTTDDHPAATPSTS